MPSNAKVMMPPHGLQPGSPKGDVQPFSLSASLLIDNWLIGKLLMSNL